MLLLQTNAIADALNSSEWVFPIAECFHIAAFAWSIGLIALVDFRLMGVGMKRESASEIARATAPWTLLGLAVVLLVAAAAMLAASAVSSTMDFMPGFAAVAASRLALRRPARMTWLPRWWNCSASASPMPEPPPVMRMVLPVRFMGVLSLQMEF